MVFEPPCVAQLQSTVDPPLTGLVLSKLPARQGEDHRDQVRRAGRAILSARSLSTALGGGKLTATLNGLVIDASRSVTSLCISTLSQPSPISSASATVERRVVAARFLVQSFLLVEIDELMLLSDVLRFMTDPIRVKLLLRPLTSNFPPEFFRLNPEPRLLANPSRFGEMGGCVRCAPHWSTSLYPVISGIVALDRKEGAVELFDPRVPSMNPVTDLGVVDWDNESCENPDGDRGGW